jgi:uroporphyrinogen decarboxylase
VVVYLNAQIEAGAQALMVFDTWGGVLTPEAYQEFSLRYMQQIVDQLHREYDGTPVPVTLFTKGGGQWIERVAATGCDAVGLDWTVAIDQARARVGQQVALQGNLDPNVLYGDESTIRQQVQNLMEKFGPHPGHVFNLGHGIHQTVEPDRVKVLVDAVHELGRLIRQ